MPPGEPGVEAILDRPECQWVTNKEMKMNGKNGKPIRVVPLQFKEEAAPLSVEETRQEQLELDKDLISIGW